MNDKFIIKSGEVKTLNQVWTFGKSREKKEILIKAVVEDGGELKARGKLVIKKNVKNVDVFLKYKVLLLGKSSLAEVDPELEIESNEIKAGHAASIGRVNEEELFYLMSRGLTKKEATELLVEAFLND